MMTERQLRSMQRELVWHVNNHPSERWEAKLKAVNEILAGDAPVKGAEVLTLSNQFSSCNKSSPRPHRERVQAGGW